jgi:hypothetical protein
MDIFTIITDNAQTITAICVIVALLISFSSFPYPKRHNDYQRLIEVYKMINDFEQRESRKNAYTAFRIYMERHYESGLKIGGKTYFAKNLNEHIGKTFLDFWFDFQSVLNKKNHIATHGKL